MQLGLSYNTSIMNFPHFIFLIKNQQKIKIINSTLKLHQNLMIKKKEFFDNLKIKDSKLYYRYIEWKTNEKE